MNRRAFLFNVFGLLFFFLSCKKGEDDPAFTLASRKARVEGDWKLDGGSIKIGIKDSTGAYEALIYKLNKSLYTRDEVGSGAHYEEPCKLNITFTKKGNVIIKQTMDSLSAESRGSWDFQAGVGKNKNKERINIQLESTNSYLGMFRMFNKTQTNFTYRIKELRSKKMVLVCDEEMVILNSSFGVYITSEYTFSQ